MRVTRDITSVMTGSTVHDQYQYCGGARQLKLQYNTYMRVPYMFKMFGTVSIPNDMTGQDESNRRVRQLPHIGHINRLTSSRRRNHAKHLYILSDVLLLSRRRRRLFRNPRMPLNPAATFHNSRLPTTIVQGKKPVGASSETKKGVIVRK